MRIQLKDQDVRPCLLVVHSNVRDGSAAAIETGMSELEASSSSIVPGIMRVGIGG